MRRRIAKEPVDGADEDEERDSDEVHLMRSAVVHVDTVTLQQYVWHSASAAACVALCLYSSVWQSVSAAT